MLAGFGAIPADLARSIAKSAATITALLTDPDATDDGATDDGVVNQGDADLDKNKEPDARAPNAQSWPTIDDPPPF